MQGLFTFTDQKILASFTNRFGLEPNELSPDDVLDKIANALQALPYENLTKIIKSDAVINVQSAMRFPDEVCADFIACATGGTCFSLTAMFVALLRHFHFEAHPILADRHYGPDTHCALVVRRWAGWALLDPGYLIHRPLALPETVAISHDNGFNTLELVPVNDGVRVELYTIVNGNRRLRLTYKTQPVDEAKFRSAWAQSFAWEMMTYPVLTRCTNDVHHYLQGKVLKERNRERTQRTTLDIEQQGEFITRTIGIKPDILKKAFSVVKHG
ncbi:MAG: hypothetical protein GF398_06245 [Chitinivibrionales bacterium]|nr:hypothetical protein [Chitinivibrionales bacterium]